MATNIRIRDKYPVFNAYGGKHEFLDSDGAVETTVEGRIKSIWPFIVRRVLAFSETLKPRERVNYDPEDVLSEIWLALAEKDGHWTPERGKYITFAGIIIDRELCSIRDKSRTVHAPRNSSCRMKAYRSEEAAGTLTDTRRRTLNDITRTGTIAGSVGSRGSTEEGYAFEPVTISDPLTTLTERERADGMRSGLRDALLGVSPFEADVVTRLAGLNGDALTVKELASAAGRTEVEVRRAKERAMAKIRKRLSQTRNPFFAERN